MSEEKRQEQEKEKEQRAEDQPKKALPEPVTLEIQDVKIGVKHG